MHRASGAARYYILGGFAFVESIPKKFEENPGQVTERARACICYSVSAGSNLGTPIGCTFLVVPLLAVGTTFGCASANE